MYNKFQTFVYILCGICYWTIISPIYNSSPLSAINRFVYVSMSNFTTEKDIRSLEWCKSLLCWINSFENVLNTQPLNDISELTDSAIFIDCLLAATPDKSALPDSLQNDSAVKSLQFETSNIVLYNESNFSKY